MLGFYPDGRDILSIGGYSQKEGALTRVPLSWPLPSPSNAPFRTYVPQSGGTKVENAVVFTLRSDALLTKSLHRVNYEYPH